MKRLAVRFVIMNDSEEVLLATSARSGSTKLLGGGVEKDETPEQAAIRKLFEEAHLKVSETDLTYLGQVSEIISEDNPYMIDELKHGDVQEVKYYLIKTVKNPKPGEEVAGLTWVPKGEVVPKLTYPTQKEAFSTYILGEEFVSLQQWTKKVE